MRKRYFYGEALAVTDNIKPMLFLVFFIISGFACGLAAHKTFPADYQLNYNNYIDSLSSQLSIRTCMFNSACMMLVGALIAVGLFYLCTRHKAWIILGMLQSFIYICATGIAANAYFARNNIRVAILTIFLLAIPNILIALCWSLIYTYAIRQKPGIDLTKLLRQSLPGWMLYGVCVVIQLIASVLFFMLMI